MKLRIQIVYANNNMRAPTIGPIAVPGADAEVVWAREEIAGADVVLHWNSYTYRRRLMQRNPHAIRMLYMYEPVVVDPLVYRAQLWERFDHILTWNGPLAISGPPFHYFPPLSYDLPFQPGYGLSPCSASRSDLLARPRALCQICGDKFSLIPCELYSRRRSVAEWFSRHGQLPMDTYGVPGMQVANYRGPVQSKLETLSRYRYALCLENTYHPAWSAGYVTEKPLDCMAACTIPVYLGAYDVSEQLPEGTFIDLRAFHDNRALEQRLIEMSDKEYLGYVERMQAFVQAHRPWERYSCFRLYEKIVTLCEPAAAAGGTPVGMPRTEWPQGYYETLSTWNERARYRAMWVALKFYRFVYPVFAVLRWLRWLGGKVRRG